MFILNNPLDTKGSKCDYSKNMALCLQEKGRQVRFPNNILITIICF